MMASSRRLLRPPAAMSHRHLLAALAVCLTACGGDDAPVGPDAGAGGNFVLEVQNPPGESIGLPIAGTTTLRVRYLDASARPVAGAAVEFRLLTTGSESTGGSTLSADSATTDDLGIARVDLVAGAERVNFRVEARAPSAPSALFYVAVSEGGFTDVQVTPLHEGPRGAEQFASVQIRLYRSVDLRCRDAEVEALPASVFPPRSLPDFAGAVRFRNLSAGDSYAVVTWGASETGAALAFGCVDLGAGQVRSGRQLGLEVITSDRGPRLPGPLALESVLDLAPPLAGLGGAAWDTLACPLGPAQLLVDCALDAEVDDGALDCVVEAASPLRDAVEAARTPAGADGCRPPGDALDDAVAAALAPGHAPATWNQLAAARLELLTGFALRSELRPGTASTARHRLLGARAAVGAAEHEVDLAATTRPILVAPAVPWEAAADGSFALGRHGFTLRAGALLAEAFAVLALAPANLAGDDGALGSALLGGLEDGGASGCDALDGLVCAAAERPDGCLAACAAVAPALDTELARWTDDLAEGGLDLFLSGAGTAFDDDLDLAIDALAGAWDAELIPRDGAPLPVTGTLSP